MLYGYTPSPTVEKALSMYALMDKLGAAPDVTYIPDAIYEVSAFVIPDVPAKLAFSHDQLETFLDALRECQRNDILLTDLLDGDFS